MGGIGGAEEVGDGDLKTGKIHAANDETDERHDNIIYQAGDDGAEGAADDDTYGEINDAAAIDKLAELRGEGRFVDLLCARFNF